MALYKRRREFPLRVEDIMIRDVVAVKRDTPVPEIAKLMLDKNIGSVLVVDDNGKLIGIVTERDLVYAIAKGKVSHEYPAWTVMTENPVAVKPGTLIMEVVDKMRNLNVRHMPVVDEQNRPVGIVSFRDLLDAAYLFLAILSKP